MPGQQEAVMLGTFISCMLTKEILWIFEDNWTPDQLKSTLLDCTGGPWDKINAVTGKQWESTPCTKRVLCASRMYPIFRGIGGKCWTDFLTWQSVALPVCWLPLGVGHGHRLRGHPVSLLACLAVSGRRWASSWTWPRPGGPRPSPSWRKSCPDLRRWARVTVHPGYTRCLCNMTGTDAEGWVVFS